MSSDTVYRIAPLKWEKVKGHRGKWFRTYVFCGMYEVIRDDSGRWRWSYCFDEYYNEGSADCESAEDGKALAAEHWMECLSHHLEAVK